MAASPDSVVVARATQKEFKWKYLIWLGSLLALIIDALVMQVVFSEAPETARPALRAEVLGHMTFGLLVLLGATFFLEFLAAREKTEESSKQIARLERGGTAALDALAETNQRVLTALKLSQAEILPHLDVVRSCDRIGIPAASMHKVWIGLSASIRRYYWATNSMRLEVIYVPKHHEPAIAAQSRSARGGADIRKVFFYARENEKSSEAFRREIANQRAKHLQVRYCEQRTPDKILPIETRQQLRSIDFGVFDDLCVLIWHVLPDGKIADGELIFEPGAIQRYKDAFDILYREAKEE